MPRGQNPTARRVEPKIVDAINFGLYDAFVPIAFDWIAKQPRLDDVEAIVWVVLVVVEGLLLLLLLQKW